MPLTWAFDDSSFFSSQDSGPLIVHFDDPSFAVLSVPQFWGKNTTQYPLFLKTRVAHAHQNNFECLCPQALEIHSSA